MNFHIETFQNPYLPAGTTRVDAVVTVTATDEDASAGAAEIRQTASS